jgi:mannose-P-dolichol utilization defect 1
MNVAVLKSCYGVMVQNGDLFNVNCINQLVSGALSTAILAGGALLQVPQIMNMLKTKDASGLSATSLYASIIIPIPIISYGILQGHPVSNWGENVFSLIQNIIIVSLFWQWGPKPKISTQNMIGITLGFIVFTICCFLLPEEKQSFLPLSTLPLQCFSRIPQIITNYQNKNTGPLSMITFFMILAGSAARIYTTYVTVGVNLSTMSTFVVAGLFATILIVQIWIYSGSKKSSKSKKE